MNGTDSKVSIGSLILVPAIITLAITILRLVGELQGWSPLFFNKSAGGGGAIIGISWLPIIFGPYFASKLAAAGEGPSSWGKAIGASGAGLVVFILGSICFGIGLQKHMPAVMIVGFILDLVSAFMPRIGWRSFGNALLAYAFAARIPVLIVMYIAMSANGGQGWGTHYDVASPDFAVTSLGQKFFDLAVLPQMSLWIGWTAVIGGLLGSGFAAIFRRKTVTAAA
ncbi:MAG TPA: hypothetical protein VGZ29_11180 [Terriglobia bacterium]|nr:hypothetical protein [Terriglobia bacterium]